MKRAALIVLLLACPPLLQAGDNINYYSGGNHISINGRVIHPDEIVEGSGDSARETRVLEDFRAITITGPIEAEIRTGGEPAITLTADDNLLPLIRSRVEQGRLTLDLEKSVRSRHAIEAHIRVPRLEALDITGSGDTRLELGDADRMAIRLVGTGDLTASGRVGTLEIESTGAGDIDTVELRAGAVSLDSTGSGDADITALQRCELTLLGTGDITVHGNPPERHVSSLSVGEVEFE